MFSLRRLFSVEPAKIRGSYDGDVILVGRVDQRLCMIIRGEGGHNLTKEVLT